MLPILLAWYLLFSALAVAVYGADKLAARRGGRRVPEATLHSIGLCGGWPGSLIAMQLFRHKRRKGRFVLVTWLIVALHVVVLVAVLGRDAAA